MGFRIINKDCVIAMREMEENSVDSIVTDPPYGIGFMGNKWDHGVPSVQVWKEALRVLKPGGHILAFAGTRTQHRMATAIEDAGFEIRDMIAWVYGSGLPKGLNISKAISKTDEEEAEKLVGWRSTLKPALEPITVARKPLSSSLTDNVIRHGTGAYNIKECAIPTDEDIRTHATSGERGSGIFRSTGPIKTHKNDIQEAGMYPTNLIHDGSEDVIDAFPPKKSRFFYCAKASTEDREEGLTGEAAHSSVYRSGRLSGKGEGIKDVNRINHHHTVKPTSLMTYLCQLVTPPGGLILDPFCGSGSTGKAAIRSGFRFIGCEIDEAYAEIARARCEHEASKMRDE